MTRLLLLLLGPTTTLPVAPDPSELPDFTPILLIGGAGMVLVAVGAYLVSASSRARKKRATYAVARRPVSEGVGSPTGAPRTVPESRPASSARSVSPAAVSHSDWALRPVDAGARTGAPTTRPATPMDARQQDRRPEPPNWQPEPEARVERSRPEAESPKKAPKRLKAAEPPAQQRRRVKKGEPIRGPVSPDAHDGDPWNV